MDRDLTDWVKRAVTGDEAAFGVLVEQCGPWLFRRIGRTVRPRSAAEDVLQEAFLAAFEHLGELRDPASFTAWMCSVADRKVRMWHRRQATQLSYLEKLRGERPSNEPPADEVQLRGLIRRALAELSAAHRDVVVHHYLKGYSYQQTALLLDLRTDAVRSRLQKARRRLEREIERMSKAPETESFELGADDLEGLRHAAAFTSRDPQRGVLQTVCLDAGGRIVATDGCRLLTWQSKGLASLTAPVILGAVQAEGIPSSERAELVLGEDEATLRWGDGDEVTFPVMQGPYVKYEQAAGTPGPIEVVVRSPELMACVDEIEPFLTGRHSLEEVDGWAYDPRVELRVRWLEGRLSLGTSRDQGFHRVQEDAEDLTPAGPEWEHWVYCSAAVEGLADDQVLRVAVNHGLLRSIAAALGSGSGRIRVRLSEGTDTRLHFDADGGDRTALLMPMVWRKE